ncbi:hypothetical protein AVEN_91245-1 [Araneus ventricosus]|uniref:Uncharacterized protein n=1 Tax=Araneus ventricosus TaxID=182803 RepID=A0A4Y2U5D4_ARAVE|nr:hypothetical protein AVEN_91245-1 [Araneus ventricosus]
MSSWRFQISPRSVVLAAPEFPSSPVLSAAPAFHLISVILANNGFSPVHVILAAPGLFSFVCHLCDSRLSTSFLSSQRVMAFPSFLSSLRQQTFHLVFVISRLEKSLQPISFLLQMIIDFLYSSQNLQ